MANCFMHTCVQVMARPRTLQTKLFALSHDVYASYALPCSLHSDTPDFSAFNRNTMLVGILGVAQGSSVPISRGGPPI
ncbi:MAG TPA: hypothetical protein DHW02_06895 [Ktedonobacter sp.]|nr:hypothetical protein [Ktedonobacter sp.]